MGYIDGTSAIEMLDSVFEVLEGGKSVEAAKVTELIADNGAKIADITSYTTNAANGAAAEVAEVVDISAGATAGTTTGAGILAVDVGVAGAAIAPALGVLAGVGLYNLAPEFWTDVSNKLMEAGATVKGKVIGFIDANGNTSFPENVIEILKNALINAGVFQNGAVNADATVKDALTSRVSTSSGDIYFKDIPGLFPLNQTVFDGMNGFPGDLYQYPRPVIVSGSEVNCVVFSDYRGYDLSNGFTIQFVAFSKNPFVIKSNPVAGNTNATQYNYNGNPFYYWTYGMGSAFAGELIGNVILNIINLPISWWYIEPADFGRLLYEGVIPSAPTQNGAILPEPSIEFPQTYPDWLPAEFPEPLPAEMPENYPASLPLPDITQSPAQTGENANPEQQDKLLEIFYNALPDPKPHILPDPDPSATPEPEPAPNPQPEPNPTDPNPDPTPSGLTPSLPILQTTSASRMFTVYNPTDAQVNSLGAFLWTSNIIEQIKKLWENPMDGIISFHKIYGAPTTGTSKNIILGYIDSNVSALEVTSQFTDVDCGTVTVPERLHNATDYSPFTSIHLYLPFIGIVEIDTNEVMNAELHIKYRIDVYTGTCVALIYARRDADMPNEQIIYTFSGNASQKLPLTAADFSGAIGALLGLAGAGVAVASGGALGVAAGALGAAHSLTSEMVHVQHSGGLSANAGILSPRKPFMILSRQYGYDANGYSGFHGYPANKTVYIGNCNGYIKCKDVIFRGSCTEEEANEIVDLLKRGVYL